MNNPSPWQAYWIIRMNRFRKKRAIKKQLIQISFDKTTTYYSLIVGGYAFASIFIFNDLLGEFQDEFLWIEQRMEEQFWLILTIVPIRYVFKSFRNPGILISSSEYQLGMLPHPIKKIALYVAIEQWIKQLLIYSIVSTVIIIITPIDAQLVWFYFFLFWLIEVLMTIPHWKLFQVSFLVKFGIFMTLILLDIAGTILYQTKLVSIIIFSIMIVANVLLYKKLFSHVHWGRVTEVNDYLIWNMPLISKATKTKFRRERKYNLFLNRASRRKPFAYLDSPIHRRLWIQHFRENIEFILNVLGGLFLAIVIMAFVHDFIGLIGIAISIHVYTSFAASMFASRFYSGIIQVLPWNVSSYRHTMKHWAYVGFIPVIIPILIFGIVHFAWWSISFLLLVVCLLLFNLQVKMDKAEALLDKKPGQLSLKDMLAFMSLAFLLLCEYEPSISLVSIGFCIYGFQFLMRKKHVV